MIIFQILFAFGAGITIVASRSFNAYLANTIGATQSSFFNYFTGFITSILFLLCLSFRSIVNFKEIVNLPNYWMLLGGVIGVSNIIILNIVVNKIAPLQLTLFIFVSQLISGMILDVCLYQVFSFQKLFGCIIVVIGLLLYQKASQKQVNNDINKA